MDIIFLFESKRNTSLKSGIVVSQKVVLFAFPIFYLTLTGMSFFFIFLFLARHLWLYFVYPFFIFISIPYMIIIKNIIYEYIYIHFTYYWHILIYVVYFSCADVCINDLNIIIFLLHHVMHYPQKCVSCIDTFFPRFSKFDWRFILLKTIIIIRIINLFLWIY